MWTCPRCERVFKVTNQSHYCQASTLDDIFANSSDELLLAFDRLLTEVLQWEPCSVGAAKKAVVFSSKKAWLIVRPMKKELDLKFYHDEPLESETFHKVKFNYGKYEHYFRIKNEESLTEEVFQLLREGHQYSLK